MHNSLKLVIKKASHWQHMAQEADKDKPIPSLRIPFFHIDTRQGKPSRFVGL